MAVIHLEGAFLSPAESSVTFTSSHPTPHPLCPKGPTPAWLTPLVICTAREPECVA